MNVEKAREYCLSKKGVTECFPFDDVSLVMKVMDKMFALIDLEGTDSISLKCDPEYALELRERYSAINGAYHFNKKYWNSVCFDQDADDRLIEHLIDHSYEEFLKFIKKLRANMMHFPESFHVSLVYLKETESTNKYLNDLFNKQCVGELTTVTTDFQTSGRGQRGNSQNLRGQT